MNNIVPILLVGATIGIGGVAYRCLYPTPFSCVIGMEPIPSDLLFSITQGQTVRHYNLFNLLNWFLTSGSIKDPMTNLNMPDHVIDEVLSYFDLPRRTFCDILNCPATFRPRFLAQSLAMIAGISIRHVNYRRRFLEHLEQLNREANPNL